MIDQNRSYEQESVERALTCANCGQKLHMLEVHVCEHCCAELMMLDRIETVDPVDDDRIDGIKRIVRELAAATQEVK